MKKNLILKIAIMLNLFTSCENYDDRLKIRNNSEHSICFESSYDTILDTTIMSIDFLLNRKIHSGELSPQMHPGTWINVIKGSKNKKLNVFIIEYDTLIKYRDATRLEPLQQSKSMYIHKNKLYQRYEFTEEELNKSNWIIEYP